MKLIMENWKKQLHDLEPTGKNYDRGVTQDTPEKPLKTLELRAGFPDLNDKCLLIYLSPIKYYYTIYPSKITNLNILIN